MSFDLVVVAHFTFKNVIIEMKHIQLDCNKNRLEKNIIVIHHFKLKLSGLFQIPVQQNTRIQVILVSYHVCCMFNFEYIAEEGLYPDIWISLNCQCMSE